VLNETVRLPHMRDDFFTRQRCALVDGEKEGEKRSIWCGARLERALLGFGTPCKLGRRARGGTIGSAVPAKPA